MKSQKAAACLWSLLAISLLTSCGGGGMTQAPATESAAQPDHTRSWMSPNAASNDLLYVSDIYTDDVSVYSWPKGDLEGTLTGFEEPNGECIDKAGDIWIVDLKARDVIEYAHGGSSPIATLTDTYGYPVACAIEQKTGDLAVTDIFDEVSGGQGRGGLLIYRHAEGSPTQYQDAEIFYYDFCAYDDRGNLYVDGINNPSSDDFAFAELPKGTSAFSNITLSQYINYPGGVWWRGGFVDVLDELSTPSTIYEFSISGTKGTLEGSTPLNGSGGSGGWVNEFALSGSKVVAPIYDPYVGPSSSGVVNIYKYPAGGNATKSITANSRVFGAAISKAKV
jgi:hypothetical protein